MQLRALTPILAFSLTLFLSACSGGGNTAGTAAASGDCGAGQSSELFCLTSCSLGCSQAGCNINLISQNEPIRLNFNRAVDPFSLPPHTTSILLKTATGEEPVGDWIVNGSIVTFVPGVRISGSQTFFGFRPNETYTLHMPSGSTEPSVIQSLSGDKLSTEITCTLNIGDIKDLNQAPPSATLKTPTITSNVPLDTLIEIEFNEIIDPAIFVGTTPETSPIRYSVKATQLENGKIVCRSSSEAVLLPGEPRMRIDPNRGTSIVSFKPQELPGKKCIEIEVTSQVKDLAGVFAKPHTLSFTTIDVGVRVLSNVEDFTNSLFLDNELSAGTWGNGALTFSPIGGSGLHGVFDPALGKDISDPNSTVKIYEWDLDTPGGIKVPKTLTTSGKDEFVTDGRFFFQKFEVPDGVEVHFIGSIPARIWVRGTARVGGLLAANGQNIPPEGLPGSSVRVGTKNAQTGEKPGRPGPMGGLGGAGADRGDGLTNKPAFNGNDGSAVNLMAGHAYAGRFAQAGGKGSVQFPFDGNSASITFTYFNVISQQSNKGGGGAGFTEPGKVGDVVWVFPNTANQHLAATGTTAGGQGAPFPATLPVYTNGFTPQDHFLAGGAGGGGGGSGCGGAIKSIASDRWRIGRAGASGGGALAMRIGGALVVSPSGRLEAKGGEGPLDTAAFSIRGMMSPGGGGSGGSLFLQVNQKVDNTGSISVAGGKGGRTWGGPADQVFNGMHSSGGDGSPGLLHFETADDPNNYPVGPTVPATPPVASIRPNDKDDLVSIRSLWYPASLTFPPEFKRYEIKTVVDGVPVTFSDDPAVGPIASGASSPLRFFIQGAKLELDASNQLVPKVNTPIKPFRTYVGPFSQTEPALSDDGATGYRFEIILDRSLGKDVKVESIAVFWQL